VKIAVTVTPKAHVNKLVRLNDDAYKAYVRSPQEKGKANKALIAMLSEAFDVAQSSVHICRGAHARKKIVEIVGVR
jgi:hypothetical protein